jgi:hypothetical protein
MSRTLAFVVCLCSLLVESASAQDDRKVGLTIGYPSAVGVLWQVADRVAIRTDTLFSSSWIDADSSNAGDEFFRFVGGTSSTSSRTFGVGVSVLVTVARWERVRAYVAPRAAYLRSTARSEFSFSTGIPALPGLPGLPELPIRIQPATFESRSSTQTYSGSFGTQYRLADRFAAFGEVGVAYASSRPSDSASLVFGSGASNSPILGGVTGGVVSGALTTTVSSPRPRTNSLGIRSGIGIVFFF